MSNLKLIQVDKEEYISADQKTRVEYFAFDSKWRLFAVGRFSALTVDSDLNLNDLAERNNITLVHVGD